MISIARPADRSAAQVVGRCLRAVVLAPMLAYSKLISPSLPRRCRYEPTCSAYAIDAVRSFGVLRGAVLAAWRLLRCNPFSDGGYDPVEAQRLFEPRPASPRPAPTGPASPSR
jgi:uncharacterized protein